MKPRPDIRNFYVDETFVPVWEEFKQICEREGESASQKIREFIERYVIVHTEGNPQLLMTKWFEEGLKLECFFCHSRGDVLLRVKYVSGLVVNTCKSCVEKEKAKGSYSTVKKVLGVVPK